MYDYLRQVEAANKRFVTSQEVCEVQEMEEPEGETIIILYKEVPAS